MIFVLFFLPKKTAFLNAIENQLFNTFLGEFLKKGNFFEKKGAKNNSTFLIC